MRKNNKATWLHTVLKNEYEKATVTLVEEYEAAMLQTYLFYKHSHKSVLFWLLLFCSFPLQQ